MSESNGWRPITNPPSEEDGVVILFDGNLVGAGYFDWFNPDENSWYWDSSDYRINQNKVMPTHWRRLPSPPMDIDASPDKLYDDMSGFEIPGFQPCAQCKTPRACKTYRCDKIPLETNAKI